MASNKVETDRNTNVAATTDQQIIERDANGVPAPEVASPVRPWTDDFLLPSIRYREPDVPRDQPAH